MKNLKKLFALSVIALFAFSCSSSDDGAAETPVATVKDVYVAGYESASGSSLRIPKCWKNGTGTILQNFAGGSAESVFVSGTDVYVAGNSSAGGGTNYAVYWKNSIQVNVSSNTDSFATGIFVVGSDVYVCGYEKSAGTYRARYWKNGVVYSLSDGTKDAYARGIFVSGTDVYVCGVETAAGGNGTAKYWKNSVAVNLTAEAYGCNATAIKVVGSDIFVSGRDGNDAVYWKNGTKTVVSTPTAGSYFQGNGMALNGSDVYVAGWEETPGPTQARIWKNGVATNLNNQGLANDVSVSPAGDVYVVGRDVSSAARVWLNGTGTTLSAAGSFSAEAKSIFLTYN